MLVQDLQVEVVRDEIPYLETSLPFLRYNERVIGVRGGYDFGILLKRNGNAEGSTFRGLLDVKIFVDGILAMKTKVCGPTMGSLKIMDYAGDMRFAKLPTSGGLDCGVIDVDVDIIDKVRNGKVVGNFTYQFIYTVTDSNLAELPPSPRISAPTSSDAFSQRQGWVYDGSPLSPILISEPDDDLCALPAYRPLPPPSRPWRGPRGGLLSGWRSNRGIRYAQTLEATFPLLEQSDRSGGSSCSGDEEPWRSSELYGPVIVVSDAGEAQSIDTYDLPVCRITDETANESSDDMTVEMAKEEPTDEANGRSMAQQAADAGPIDGTDKDSAIEIRIESISLPSQPSAIIVMDETDNGYLADSAREETRAAIQSPPRTANGNRIIRRGGRSMIF